MAMQRVQRPGACLPASADERRSAVLSYSCAFCNSCGYNQPGAEHGWESERDDHCTVCTAPHPEHRNRNRYTTPDFFYASRRPDSHYSRAYYVVLQLYVPSSIDTEYAVF